MGLIKRIWRKMTHTSALDKASGKYEIAFFEDVYRVAFAAGLSRSEDTIIYQIYSTVVKLMIALIICGEVWFAYSEPLGMDEAAACVNVIVIQIITLFKVKNMVNHQEIYKKVAQSMENSYFDTNTNKRKELVNFWATKHANYVKLLLGLGNCTLAAWHLYPLIDELDYNLMIGVHLPFRYDSSLRYPLTYIIVGIAFVYISHFVMVTDLTMQAHLVPLICQLDVLADCFKNIVQDCSLGIDVRGTDLTLNNDFVRKYLTRLGNLAEQHKLILNHSMDLRDILSGPMLGQLAASGTLICFVGYQATTSIVVNITKCLMSLFYLGYNMFGLYIICRWCEEITVQSFNIGEAIYCSGWQAKLAVLPGVRSTMLLIIARANKPLVFTAGGMYNLSLKSFTTLVKTSYSALTVLLRFNHE